MAIEFNDRLEAIWQVMWEGGNWLAAVSRAKPPGVGFEVVWRFRYYVDEDLTRDSKDIKNWYEATAPQMQLKEVLGKVAFVARTVVEAKHGQLYQLFREGRSTSELFEAFRSLPHMHSETLDANPVEACE
jgi:hypothetical protein